MNIIDAILNLISNPKTKVTEYYHGKNRANNAGDALEEYVKDLFSGTFDCDTDERNKIHSEIFSYLGNNNNPPDVMLKNGDAIEIKKLETETAPLTLNSSYPEHRLNKSNPKISTACQNAENWEEKDIIYVVGVQRKNKLKRLCMVYGTEYCASEECYQRIFQIIKNKVESTPGIDFSESKELGHINKIDPLGVTYFRIRGMWGIQNPWKVFDYIYKKDPSKDFDFMCIINKEKWETLEGHDKLIALSKEKENLSITDKKVKNPDNPAKLIDVVLISFYI